MKNNHLHIKAALLIALLRILYGFMGYFGINILKENFSADAMLFWRFFIAGLWMFA